MKKILWCSALFLIFASVKALALDEVAIIVHPSNTEPLDRALIAKIYMGKVKYWANGSPIMAVDQAEALPIYDKFYRDVLKKNPALVKNIWTQNIFTGKQQPPKILDPDAEVKRIVKENKNAIGYIKPSYVDDTVKVIAP